MTSESKPKLPNLVSTNSHNKIPNKTNNSKIKVKYLNVDRKKAQQLEILNKDKDLLILAEPNYNKKKLFGLRTQKYTAVTMPNIALCYKNNIKIQPIINTDDMIIARINDIVIVTIYWSPNEPNEEINTKIKDLEQIINDNFKKQKVILIGDFNTRSSMYEKLKNISYNKARSNLFENFLTTNHLIVKNQYNIKIFENKNGSSVIDLLITNEKIKNQITNIKIKNENLACHKSINFEIAELSKNTKEDPQKMWIVNYKKFEEVIEKSDFSDIQNRIKKKHKQGGAGDHAKRIHENDTGKQEKMHGGTGNNR